LLKGEEEEEEEEEEEQQQQEKGRSSFVDSMSPAL
jgi:hypothetical protein